jgi:hypothetical protein
MVELENKLSLKNKEVYEFKNVKELKLYGKKFFDSIDCDNTDRRIVRLIGWYTFWGSGGINNYERNREKIGDKPRRIRRNENLSQEIQKHEIKSDLYAYKGIDTKGFGKMLNIPKSFSVADLLKENDGKDLIGKILRDRAFISTSVLQNCAKAHTFTLKIKIPKGTKAIYIEPISAHPDERELLIDRGQRFVITNVILKDKEFITDKDNYIIQCELVDKNKLQQP